MMNSSNWKSIALVVAIFICGGLAGAGITIAVTSHRPPGPRDLQRFLVKRLDLTPEQTQKVAPILTKLNQDIDATRRDARQRISSLIDDAHAQIATVLTPEQKQRLEQMQRERHERVEHAMHRRRGSRMDGHPNN
jgi:Spy/CpxP family protein refolding chaperone